MSLKIDEYLSYNSLLSTQTTSNSNSQAASTTDTSKATDSYISTIGSEDEAIPCENYNDFVKVFNAAKSEQDNSATYGETTADSSTDGTASAASSSEEAEEASGSSSSGSGSGSSESETTTEVVTINGVTYLQTTTVEDGVTTVEKQVIGTQAVSLGGDED